MPKPRTCQNCASTHLKRRSTTYPVQLAGRQINVQRVMLHECADCGFLMPTSEGQEKIQRCIQTLSQILADPPP
jgi:hypothetical protein